MRETQQAWQIARRALHLAGAAPPPPQEPSGALIETALGEMDLILAEQSNNFYMPFLIVNNQEISITEGTEEYDLADLDSPLEFVSSVLLRDADGNDTALAPLTLPAWGFIADKARSGTPTHYTTVFGPDSALLLVWPVPDNDEYSLVINGRTHAAQPGYGGDAAGIPPAWSSWLAYATAESLLALGLGDSSRLSYIASVTLQKRAKLEASAVSNMTGLKGFVAYRDV